MATDNHSRPAASQVFPFLSLPRELRNMIYHAALNGTTMVLQRGNFVIRLEYGCPSDFEFQPLPFQDRVGLPKLLRANKQVLDEGIQQLHQKGRAGIFASSFPPFTFFPEMRLFDLRAMNRIVLDAKILFARRTFPISYLQHISEEFFAVFKLFFGPHTFASNTLRWKDMEVVVQDVDEIKWDMHVVSWLSFLALELQTVTFSFIDPHGHSIGVHYRGKSFGGKRSERHQLPILPSTH